MELNPYWDSPVSIRLSVRKLFLVIESPPGPLVWFFRNLPELFPQWSSCARPNMVPVRRQNLGARGQLWFSPLSHLLRNHWRNFAETLHMNFSQCVDVSARKWFWSVNKYGRMAAIFKIDICPLLNTVTISFSHLLRDHWSDFFKLAWDVPLVAQLCSPENGSGSFTKMAAGNHIWFSPLSHLLRNHWRNFVETLHMNSSHCLDVSARKRFWSVNKYGWTAAIFKIANCPLLNTVTISLSHLLRDHWSDFFKLAWDVPLVV